jgi:hypothetical protein
MFKCTKLIATTLSIGREEKRDGGEEMRSKHQGNIACEKVELVGISVTFPS